MDTLDKRIAKLLKSAQRDLSIISQLCKQAAARPLYYQEVIDAINEEIQIKKEPTSEGDPDVIQGVNISESAELRSHEVTIPLLQLLPDEITGCKDGVEWEAVLISDKDAPLIKDMQKVVYEINLV